MPFDFADPFESGQEEYKEKRMSYPHLVNSNSSVPEGTSVEEAARYLLEQTTGLKSDDGHGDDTPARFVKMLRSLTTSEPFEFTCFDTEEGENEMILQQDITFVSVCNHHVLPFIGKAHVAYIPDAKIVGLSKLARVVRYYAANLQVQERLTTQIADRLEHELNPLGVAVVMQAEHTCMTIRGVRAPGSYTTTSAMRGVFASHDRTAKAEFFQLISSARQL
jgi:GTP cyclohydrolase I